MSLDEKGIDRGTKCLSAFHGTDLSGAYPRGYLKWVKEKGWWGDKRVHLCSGRVSDEGSFRVDIRPEMSPDLVADARSTGLEENRFDCCLIDPPYSKELANKLYGTEEYYSSINDFTREGLRIVRPGGFVVSISYEIPKIPKGAELVAVWGVYTIPHTSFLRCVCVFRKKEVIAGISGSDGKIVIPGK